MARLVNVVVVDPLQNVEAGHAADVEDFVQRRSRPVTDDAKRTLEQLLVGDEDDRALTR